MRKKLFWTNIFFNNDKTDDQSEKNFCKLLKALLYTNEEFPNMGTLNSLKSAHKLLNAENKINENKIENSKKDENEEGIFITSKKDLTKKKLRKSKIYEINMNKNNFKMLKFLNKEFSKNKNAHYLTKLILSGNNLKSIKFLVKTKSN